MAAETDQLSSAGPRAALRRVPDPRKRRGLRHQISVILMIAGCAVMAGARSFAAIGAWAAQSTQPPAGARRALAVDGKTPRGSAAIPPSPAICWPRSTVRTHADAADLLPTARTSGTGSR
jgi:hypothetical protein